ncbi:MAG: histidinol-phosphate transaminase [Bacteroidetes bacterium]|nr:histidinol-phosphate transaminase [Bacteroidota bacterium]MDA0859523.1 histidinol-phosphate transaminase [Bacteroidota bacterium]MDA1317891.1 histidinol-phosphate transaminase [Bacteroidota bacterium]
MDLKALIRPSIAAMKPYSSARDEFQSQDNNLVFLDANESPFQNDLNRYPDPQQILLKTKLATLKQVLPDQILLGNGSDEVLDLLFRAFCEPNQDAVLTLTPTYGIYGVLANLNAIENQAVTLNSKFQIKIDDVLKAIHPNTKMIFICSPNNPSGNLLDTKAIEGILEAFGGLVVIDEAYIDFTDSKSWIERLSEFPNLVVTQTLSKAYGLAGIRLGICYASTDIISVLNKIKPPYNINLLTQNAAFEGISNQENTKKQIDMILSEREKLIQNLNNLSFVKTIFPSDANFILIRVDDANMRYTQLIAKGIIVRNRHGQPLCDHCLRITVGTPEENLKLIQALQTI